MAIVHMWWLLVLNRIAIPAFSSITVKSIMKLQCIYASKWNSKNTSITCSFYNSDDVNYLLLYNYSLIALSLDNEDDYHGRNSLASLRNDVTRYGSINVEYINRTLFLSQQILKSNASDDGRYGNRTADHESNFTNISLQSSVYICMHFQTSDIYTKGDMITACSVLTHHKTNILEHSGPLLVTFMYVICILFLIPVIIKQHIMNKKAKKFTKKTLMYVDEFGRAEYYRNLLEIKGILPEKLAKSGMFDLDDDKVNLHIT
ncbi:hypothetical protein GJ496_006606 [Pomphorhynchus laevis]|nr:hypothetical protein GJ496_006606 [Pomphorhynchus laevis]